MRPSINLFLSSLTLAVSGLSFIMPAAAESVSKTFTLNSPDLKDGKFGMDFVFNSFGCNGKNLSPALEWSNPPAGTKSFALMMHDKDAPTGSGFWHWTIYNIPVSATSLEQSNGNSIDKLPKPAIAGLNDMAGTNPEVQQSYVGPCPPEGHGSHRYTITLFALDVADMHAASGIPATATPSLHGFALNYAMGKHVLGKAQLTATFERR
ncbi:YbhB/YbcL family Raf kinase inhibitor-like protein [Undibacterium jejuense]|uniref:YbhB/YbcL family Raf kinase inhibitor-like protein n=1 Tax=Undibacterium jejuense TaxID=1344949 RepID=A0A923KP34_9BURK|nr:YbhB/YbcL family Raf kinase inhibitor-like protein [Undibacterium jejuense]MBC3861764.1 YbhB/YbcL family Raf kinase inhibitor-like protein [Undibacterium jejuense]